MDLPNTNSDKPIVDASDIVAQTTKPTTKPLNKKPIIIIVALVVFLMLVIAGIFYFFVYRDSIAETENASANVYIPNETEIDYFNEEFDFKMIVNKDWNINEFGTKVEFNVGNDGKIYFEAFEDSEFANISEIDERFCDSFEEGFKEGLSGNDFADNFDFKLFEQNNLNGCTAEGEILDGFRQKYNVFYNPELELVYSIFYTSANAEKEGELSEAMSTFRLAE